MALDPFVMLGQDGARDRMQKAVVSIPFYRLLNVPRVMKHLYRMPGSCLAFMLGINASPSRYTKPVDHQPLNFLKGTLFHITQEWSLE